MSQENLPATPNHKPNGDFAAGNNANPTGGNGNQKGFQKAGTRFQHYLGWSREKLLALAGDKEALNKLPQRDYLIVITLAHAEQQTKEGLKARQEAFDRAYGKSTQMLGSDPENPFITPLPDKFPSVEEAAARYLAETKARPA